MSRHGEYDSGKVGRGDASVAYKNVTLFYSKVMLQITTSPLLY